MNLKAEAKIFVSESLNERGAVDAARVKAVCDYIEQKAPPARRIPLLRLYMKLLKPLLAREDAEIEVSGEISEAAYESLKDFLRSETGRSDLRFRKVISPELLGGVRLTCGDNIWERSAALSLKNIGNF